MSRSPSTRPPTPLYPADSGLGDLHTIHSLPQTQLSSRSSVVSSAASSWTYAMSSRSFSPGPLGSLLPPPHAINHLQPSPLPLSNTGYAIPTPAFPIFAGYGQYTPHLSCTGYISLSPPSSHLGSISSPRTIKSSYTHPNCGTRHRLERLRDERSAHNLDTVPCQICLQPETVCTSVGGDYAQLRMQKAAREALNRRTEDATNPSATQPGRWPESQARSRVCGGVWHGNDVHWESCPGVFGVTRCDGRAYTGILRES